VQWLRGQIEEIPLPRESVDVVISNCVINLSGDKAQVLREAVRVLRPGGRFAVSDVVADPEMDHATRADMQAYTGCIAGALTRDEFTEALHAAGLTDVTLTETHRVHASAASAIVRATKPGTRHEAAASAAAACCSTTEQASCCEPSRNQGAAQRSRPPPEAAAANSRSPVSVAITVIASISNEHVEDPSGDRARILDL
jgi:hypothetical protein